MIHSLVDDSLSILRFELSQLRHLLSIIDSGIRTELSKLELEIKLARATRTSTHPLEDQKDTEDWIAVAELGRYENYISIVMGFVVFERFLMDVLNTADSEIDQKNNEKERQFFRWSDYVGEFRARLAIDLRSEPFSSLDTYREIRNKIAHQGAQTLGGRSGNDYIPGREIALSEEDARRCLDLVESCCSEIRNRYLRKARRHLEERARREDEWDPFVSSGNA